MEFVKGDGIHTEYIRDGKVDRVQFKLCFPYIKEKEFISVQDMQGKELAFIDSLDFLSGESKKVVEEKLRFLYSSFKILKVLNLRNEYGVLYWEVDTDKGIRVFQSLSSERAMALEQDHYKVIDIDGDSYQFKKRHISPAMFEEFLA